MVSTSEFPRFVWLKLNQACPIFSSGQDDITEEVFRPAEREHRPAMGFLHDNE